MKRYKIHYGLGGGFGGATEEKEIECETFEEAEKEAFEECCQYYEMYDGLHGLRSVEDIMKDEYVFEEEAEEIWEEERESWLNYWVEEVE